MIAAYPLSWPPGVARIQSGSREAGAFRTELRPALKNVERSLQLFGSDSRIRLTDIVLSSNVSLAVDKPADPGIAAWFVWDGAQRCIAVDRYRTPAANLQAIHHVLEARRVELRHGTLAMVRATFQGLRALPPPPPGRRWHDVLGVSPDASPDTIGAAHRKLAPSRHPDTGGSADAMAELNAARDAGLKERG